MEIMSSRIMSSRQRDPQQSGAWRPVWVKRLPSTPAENPRALWSHSSLFSFPRVADGKHWKNMTCFSYDVTDALSSEAMFL